MVRHSGLMVVTALVFAGIGGWGIARLPTAFIPNEDQGYVLIGLQLADGASLERTQTSLDQVSKIAQTCRACERSFPSPASRYSTTVRPWQTPGSPMSS